MWPIRIAKEEVEKEKGRSAFPQEGEDDNQEEKQEKIDWKGHLVQEQAKNRGRGNRKEERMEREGWKQQQQENKGRQSECQK